MEKGFAADVLGWPLSAALGLVALVQLALWLPHYLTWPYWADHDVFVHAARAWDLGQKPYRDVRLNNFPGTIYLFWLIGKTAGWGRPWAFHAFDAALVLAFLGGLIAWSQQIFGRVLPGLVGGLAFLSVYLSLDYTLVAQRDWQAPCLALLALMIAQGWPGRNGRIASALLVAMGFAIRPQVVLFLPALLAAVTAGREVRRGAGWLALFGGFAALMFLPLAIDGTLGDFVRSLQHVALGSRYNRTTPASVVKAWLVQAAGFRWLVVPAGIFLMRGLGGERARVGVLPWLLALAGASLYKPLSPMAHAYLDLPLALAWSVNLGLLAGLVIGAVPVPAAARLAGVLALLGLGSTTLRPEFCAVGPSLKAATSLRAGITPEAAPPGYRRGPVPSSAFYDWADYRDSLAYLRDHTGASTKIANALKAGPAIVSEVDRRSSFPSESVAWLWMVAPEDEPAFVTSLQRAGLDSVVVWSPGEAGPDPAFRTLRVDDAIRRLYALEARFGAIEVWRRRGDAAFETDPPPGSTP